jgi:assimilatory nitrate reductase catalytic subunit
LVSAGPIVCACFSVGLATIRDAIRSGAASSVEAIGAALRAGTNCGSCLPELKRIVAEARAAATPVAPPALPTLGGEGAREPSAA